MEKGITAGNAVKIGLSFAVSSHEHLPDTSALMATTQLNIQFNMMIWRQSNL